MALKCHVVIIEDMDEEPVPLCDWWYWQTKGGYEIRQELKKQFGTEPHCTHESKASAKRMMQALRSHLDVPMSVRLGECPHLTKIRNIRKEAKAA
ncbi:hypothetical protein [Desulfatibacillum aliphaticivorans]|uniref:hypothetical protein n=1 Tax=Desulfatibacillum aliphaticivorans TaxID=218208 RepID=UPI000413F1F9|nr:hypothetical protein [Desulfatibacillum aliphaticivorans]